MTLINNSSYLGRQIMKNVKYSLYLNKVRKNLAAPGKLLLSSPKGAYCWCSTTGTPDRYVPVGDLDRSPLIEEPLSKSYGEHWLPARFVIKVRPSPRTRAISFALCLASTCFRVHRDPIGLVQRFPGFGYASAGNQPTLFAMFSLSLVPSMQNTG